TRLSKRHGATSVLAYRDMGYLPDALVNYLVRLGWSYGDQEVFTRQELIDYFSFENVGKSSAIFNPEKLLWLNSQYIMKSDDKELAELVIPFLIKDGTIEEGTELDFDWLSKAVKTLKERAKTLVELSKMLRYYIAEEVEYEEKARQKFLNPSTFDYLVMIRDSLKGITEFTAQEIEKVFREIIEKHNLKLGQIAQPVRVAMTGGTESPGIFEVLEVMGKEKAIKRLDRAIKYISEGR
ncbi:MAG: glutamate--tRNA ligase, partial [Thermodesulfovibrionales bacterium]